MFSMYDMSPSCQYELYNQSTGSIQRNRRRFLSDIMEPVGPPEELISNMVFLYSCRCI